MKKLTSVCIFKMYFFFAALNTELFAIRTQTHIKLYVFID